MTTSKKSVHLLPTHLHAAATPVSRFREAYDHNVPAMKALAADALATVNVDIPSAGTTVLGAMPEIVALRAEIADAMPKFDLHTLDGLEGYALAMLHAHSLYIASSTPSGEVATILEEGIGLRESLYADAQALGRHGLIDPRRLSQLKASSGYKVVAMDLMSLANVLREAWPKIQGKTAIEAASLDRAESLADRIISAVGAREQAPAAVAEVAQMRQRAFTLFVRAYDEVRRVIGFLRWKQGDLDTIAPSLYAGRSARRAKSDPAPAGTPAPSEAAAQPTPTPSPVAPVAHAPAAPGASPVATA